MYKSIHKAMAGAATAVLLLGATAAQAGLLTQHNEQTVDGEFFNFSFTDVPEAAVGATGTLVLHARGDYTYGQFEYIEIWLDGSFYDIAGALPTGSGEGDPGEYDFITEHVESENIEFQRTFEIDAGSLAAILADGTVDVTLELNQDVNWFHQYPNFVDFSLSYEDAPVVADIEPDPVDDPEPTSQTSIPEPATLALFGLGLAGLGFARRRRLS